MNRKLAVAGVAIAAIAALAWFIRSRNSDSGAPDPSNGSAAALRTTAPKADVRSSVVTVSARGGDLMIDDDPRGDLRLEGQVIDSASKGVAGATVIVNSAPPRIVKSEDDGSFAIDGLIARPYTLVARAPTGVAGPITAQLTAKSEPVILKLRAGGTLTVTVTANGKPVDATVELRSNDQFGELTAEATGGVAKFVAVPPGSYQIAASAAGMAKTFQWIGIGSGNYEARLSLSSGAAVSGRVVDDRGVAVAGARVRASGASDWSQQGSDRLDAAVTGPDGAFTVDALAAGSFRLQATHPEHAPASSELLTLDGRTARGGVQITMSSGAVVRGKVIDAQKRPVASARVRIGVAGNPRSMRFEQPRQTFSGSDGTFEMRGLPRQAQLAIAIHHSGSSTSVELDTSAGDVSNVTLTIDMTGTIAGIVVDPAGQPLEGMQVSAGPNFADSRARSDFAQWRLRGQIADLTDSAGHFTLSGLAPGDYMISAASSTAVGRGRAGDGIPAKPGDTNVKLVVKPEGGFKGKVAFADGTAPSAFTVSIGMRGQPQIGGDGEFVLDGLAPQRYEVSLRGPSFQTKTVEVMVESNKLADLGTITVIKGRTIGGVVLADGKPVPGAQVHVGRMVFGNGTSSNANFGPMAAGTKHDVTDDRGAFSFAGFPDGDIAIVAEHESIGRSRALRLPTALPNQTELTLTLEKFASLTGVLRQNGKPVEGVFVSCQSTSTPGVLYSVASGPDGAYRFDRLAPDRYKVSATVGMPMTGMKFYSKQIDVAAGVNATLDLTVDPGAVGVDVTLTARNGSVGVANVYLATGAIDAKSSNELNLALAAMPPGSSQWVIVRRGEPAHFGEVAPGVYSVCAVPFPSEVRGFGAMGYAERHGDSLLAFCKSLTVAGAPETQPAQIQVELPPFIDDGTGSGSGPPPGGPGGPGPGPGSGPGSGSAPPWFSPTGVSRSVVSSRDAS